MHCFDKLNRNLSDIRPHILKAKLRALLLRMLSELFHSEQIILLKPRIQLALPLQLMIREMSDRIIPTSPELQTRSFYDHFLAKKPFEDLVDVGY